MGYFFGFGIGFDFDCRVGMQSGISHLPLPGEKFLKKTSWRFYFFFFFLFLSIWLLYKGPVCLYLCYVCMLCADADQDQDQDQDQDVDVDVDVEDEITLKRF